MLKSKGRWTRMGKLQGIQRFAGCETVGSPAKEFLPSFYFVSVRVENSPLQSG